MRLEQLLRAAGLDSRLEPGFQLRRVESHAVCPGLPGEDSASVCRLYMYSLRSWDSWGALQSPCSACAETSQVRQGLGTGSGRIR